MPTDLLLENARVVDGTGAPWFRGAVAVADGTIRAVERGDGGGAADERVDVDGAVVAPGFVDLHSHSDLEVFADPTLAPKLRQGITTEVLGQDGFSLCPLSGGVEEWRDHLVGLTGDVDREWSWGSTADYLDAIEESGVAPNVGVLVGHGTVRYDVLGMADRDPTGDELDEMAALVAESLDDGALGLSTGLVYTPQVYADTEEVRRLAAELRPYGRPFVAHVRSEGRWLWEALDEFVDVGADAGVPIHLSHYKLSGAAQQGKAARANGAIEAARERGVDFTAEQYPYTAGNTALSALLPPWVLSEDADRRRELLADPDARERIRRDVTEWRIEGWENVGGQVDPEELVVTNVDDDRYEGRSLAAVAADLDVHYVDALCEVLLDAGFDAGVVVHSMAEADVREIMSNERVAVATDGIFGGRPHPRVHGTYPRVLGRYVREANLLSLEEAVRKMTSLPARVVGLDRKGLIRPGMDADLVVFDPDVVGSPATFDDPSRPPRGVRHVLVDGEFVVRDEATTGATPGDVLRA